MIEQPSINNGKDLVSETFDEKTAWKASDREHKEGKMRSGVILLNGFVIGAICIYGHWTPQCILLW